MITNVLPLFMVYSVFHEIYISLLLSRQRAGQTSPLRTLIYRRLLYGCWRTKSRSKWRIASAGSVTYQQWYARL